MTFFAARHIGPAFSFALIDVLSLFGLMQGDDANTFDENHPAIALRFRAQLERMREDGWWKHVSELPSEHVSLIESLADNVSTSYKFTRGDVDLPRELIEFLLPVIPLIHSVICEITPNVASNAFDFGAWRSRLEDCLVNGIVPSALISDDSVLSPTPTSMINASYCVYLTRLSELMNKLEGQDVLRPEHRRKWVQRLEEWTMKGIDDYFLLSDLRERT